MCDPRFTNNLESIVLRSSTLCEEYEPCLNVASNCGLTVEVAKPKHWMDALTYVSRYVTRVLDARNDVRRLLHSVSGPAEV